jgi:hypothetical protein
MTTKKNIFLIVLLVFVAVTANSQVKYSNEFLSLGVGSRGLSMGNACVASSNDVTSTYWNPIGILKINSDAEIGLIHSAYSNKIAKYDYAGAAFKLSDSAAIGFSLIRFGVDDVPNTLEMIDENGQIDYDLITSFSIADYAFMTSFAKRTNISGLSFGGNLKIIRRTVGEFASAWGFGLDFSAMYEHKSWIFSAMARDVTGTFNAWKFNTETFEDVFNETGNEIPVNSLEYTMPRIILATSKNIKISEKFNVLAEIDVDVTTDGKRNTLLKTDVFSFDPHAGIEASYKKKIFLRAGVSNIQKIPVGDENSINFQPGLGLGVVLNKLYIDYTLSNIGNKAFSIYSHVFTVRIALNKKSSSAKF